MALERNLAQLKTYREQESEAHELLKGRMGMIKHKVAVISGKGGVGKSTITVNLATAYAMLGNRVGILDADIHGPSVPRLLGLVGKHAKVGPTGVFPVEAILGMKVMSIDFFLSEQMPTIWRGPLKMRAIKQFLTEIVWGELDYLFIDLPPGTGDEPLSIAQLLPDLDGVVIVTMPSVLSSAIVTKAVTFARTVKLPIIGVVENMSGFVCPHCGIKTEIFQSGGGAKMALDVGVDFLGSIPIDPKVGVDSDNGTPFVLAHKDSASTKAFIEIVDNISKRVNKNSMK